MLPPVCRQAKALLAREARCLERGVLSPLYCDDGEIQQLRRGLFGTAMRHGGSSLPLLMAIDRLWLGLLRAGAGQEPASAPGEVSGQAGASSSSS